MRRQKVNLFIVVGILAVSIVMLELIRRILHISMQQFAPYVIVVCILIPVISYVVIRIRYEIHKRRGWFYDI